MHPWFFQDDGHEYYAVHGKSKRRVPSVTQVIREAGYLEWIDHVDPSVLREAQDRGARVHGACEAFLLYEKRDVTLQELGSWRKLLEYYKEDGYFSAFIDFQQAHRPRVRKRSIEHRFMHRSQLYAGQLDFECRIGQDDWLIDIKSGGYDPAARLQTVAYLFRREPLTLVRQMSPKAETGRRAILELRPDGAHRLRPFPVEDNWADWMLFRAALETWHGKRRLAIFKN